MPLKIRLIISYIAMILVPVFLSVAATFIIAMIFVRGFSTSYNVNLYTSPYRQLIEKGLDFYTDVKEISSDNPDRFQDKAYLSEFDSKLKKINSGIIVRKNNSIIYSSSQFSNSGIINELPRFGSANDNRKTHMLLGNDASLIRQQDFYFKDNSEGSVFLITSMVSMEKLLERFLTTVAIVILFILILTDGLLTYLVSRSVLKPIETLKHSANQIKNGNLNFKISSSSKDEIGELCEAFEEMRGKLKESVDIQLQYENNRKELISNISHDLKTPVTAIKGYVEGIMDGIADSPEKMDKYIKTIYRKASDIDRLIDELFLFSKLDLNKVPFNFESLNIANYMRDCVEELKLDLEKRNFNISYNTSINDNCMVVADRERLKRVIINIVGNSVKYNDKNMGYIDINLREDADKNIVIEIKDNGMGIPEKAVPFIFERFFMSDLSRNTLNGGSGLGLAIAKLIIEEHGGNIWAESTEGVGTSIYFTLKQIDENKGSDSNEEDINN